MTTAEKQSAEVLAESDRVLLILQNRHYGTPPKAVKTPSLNEYVGFFEDGSADQWIVTIDRESRTGKLYGGDIDWSEPLDVVDGGIDADVIIAWEVRKWLSACWSAAMSSGL
jgi:hypothetical protein